MQDVDRNTWPDQLRGDRTSAGGPDWRRRPCTRPEREFGQSNSSLEKGLEDDLNRDLRQVHMHLHMHLHLLLHLHCRMWIDTPGRTAGGGGPLQKYPQVGKWRTTKIKHPPSKNAFCKE